MLEFDEAELVRILERSSCRCRAVFAALVASRLSVSFEIFCLESGRPHSQFTEALNLLWDHLSDDSWPESESLSERVIELAPAEEDGVWKFSAQAEDAVASLAYAVLAVGRCSAQDAAWAARRSYEAADNLVVSRNESLTETQILSDTIVQTELAQQAMDLKLASEFVPQERLHWLKSDARARGELFWLDPRMST